MCMKTLPAYADCGHSASTNPDFVIAFVDDCGCGRECLGVGERIETYPGSCPDCLGDHDRERFWYKHCYQSSICEHEYDHTITDVERDFDSEDVVLVTPESYEICPDCKAQGYDARPGGTNPPPRTLSRIPREYEGLARQPVDSVPDVSSRIPTMVYDAQDTRILTPCPRYAEVSSSVRHGGQANRPAKIALSRPSTSEYMTNRMTKIETSKMSGVLHEEMSDDDEVSATTIFRMDSSHRPGTDTDKYSKSHFPTYAGESKDVRTHHSQVVSTRKLEASVSQNQNPHIYPV